MIGLDGSTAMTATGSAGRADLGDQRGDQGGFAGSRWPGDPDQVGPAGHWIQATQGRLGDRRPVLDRGQQPGKGEPVASDGGVAQGGRPPGGIGLHGQSRGRAFARR